MNPLLPAAFLTGSPGAGELLLLFVVILVLFGPKRLPGIARIIGKTLDEQLRNEAWNAYSCADPKETSELLGRFYEKTDAGRAGTHRTDL